MLVNFITLSLLKVFLEKNVLIKGNYGKVHFSIEDGKMRNFRWDRSISSATMEKEINCNN